MKICIAGKNTIAVNVLEAILDLRKKEQSLQVYCILNQNETGKNSWQKSLKYFADRYKVLICKLEDIYDEKELLFLSLEFDQIIKPKKFVSDKLYNIHFSLLPKYKGMYTSVLPILYNEIETGVTLHKIRSGIDTGEIIAQKKIKIEENSCAQDIYEKLIFEGSRLVIENLNMLLYESVIRMDVQPSSNSTYYSKNFINFSQLKLKTIQTACQVKNQVRAFAFRPYQFIKYNDVDIVDSRILPQHSTQKPGITLFENERGFIVSTIDYDIFLYKDGLAKLLDAIQNNKNHYAKEFCDTPIIYLSHNAQGWSPIIVATYNNNKEMFYYLLKIGASIHDKNYNGTNLLMYAKSAYVKTGDPELFEFIYNRGISAMECDYSGKNLLDYCLEENIQSIGSLKISELD